MDIAKIMLLLVRSLPKFGNPHRYLTQVLILWMEERDM